MIDADDVVERFMSGPCTEHMAERRAFLDWAFGDEEADPFSGNMHQKWNALHGDKLTLLPDGRQTDNLPDMIRLWLDSKNPAGGPTGNPKREIS